LKYLLLGLLQGATEFLPVSSSGHLVVAQNLMHVHSTGLLTEVCLHVGTLLAVLIVFRKDLWRLAVDGLKGLALVARGRAGEVKTTAPAFPTALAVVVGCVPAGIAGVLVKLTVDEGIADPRLASVMLVVTGLLLLASRAARKGTAEQVGPGRGLLIGLVQAVAILPGISRSGSTIVAGYFLGLKREAAARFSFLLAVPVMLGAGLVEIASAIFRSAGSGEASAALSRTELAGVVLGTAVAALAGWASLLLLFRIVRKGELHWFAAYCLPAGVVFFILSFLK